MRWLWRRSIWHPDALGPEDVKYRNLRRFWLPLYDTVAMFYGFAAIIYGSITLNRLFEPVLVDVVGVAFTLAATTSLVGGIFPRLIVIELVSRVLVVGFVAAYIGAIVLFASTPEPNWFMVGFISWGLPLSLWRLELIGVEIKQRREVTGG